MLTLELARADEIEACNEILQEGRRFQREQGFVQWTEDYPNMNTIRGDVAAGTGYALRADGVTAGYLCVDFSGEPAYAEIEAPSSPTPWRTAWLSVENSGEWGWWIPLSR